MNASTITKGLLLGFSALFSSPAAEAQTGTLTFVSDTTWTVSDTSGGFLGFAQNVCLNELAPLNCPAESTSYGWVGGDWRADLSKIPGASWIWAKGISGETAPAFPVEVFFSKAFILSGTPTEGTVSVAADDLAEVSVNGTSVGTIGSVTDLSLAAAAQSSLRTFEVASLLVKGTNVITVRTENGPFGCGTGPYRCNPAGVVLGGSFQFAAIDIKPGSSPNTVNPRRNGKIRVAILTTDTFDAATVSPTSVRFGRTGTEAPSVRSAQEDVDGDGDTDLALTFNTQDTGIQCGNTSATLTGETSGGQTFQASDSIRTAGCR